jgi:uncharacterized protein (DUF1778 family)
LLLYKDVLTLCGQYFYYIGDIPKSIRKLPLQVGLNTFVLKGVSAMYAPIGEGSDNETRNVTINIRAKKNQRDLIDRAAEIQGKSRSEFMLDSAQKTARDVLLDQRFFGLDEVKFQQFVELLDEPPTHHERLHELLTTKAPWD